MEMWIHNVLIH